jgi:hypothetical protein
VITIIEQPRVCGENKGRETNRQNEGQKGRRERRTEQNTIKYAEKEWEKEATL